MHHDQTAQANLLDPTQIGIAPWEAYRPALSMLTFYINRAGKNPSALRKDTLRRVAQGIRQGLAAPGPTSLD